MTNTGSMKEQKKTKNKKKQKKTWPQEFEVLPKWIAKGLKYQLSLGEPGVSRFWAHFHVFHACSSDSFYTCYMCFKMVGFSCIVMGSLVNCVNKAHSYLCVQKENPQCLSKYLILVEVYFKSEKVWVSDHSWKIIETRLWRNGQKLGLSPIRCQATLRASLRKQCKITLFLSSLPSSTTSTGP